MRNAKKITNTAYILLLIREGKVKSWEDLCRHFGLDPEFSDTVGYMLRESLASLKSAQLIDYSESSSSAAVSGFTVLPLLEKIQNCLNISVSELAASLERDRMK